MLMRSFVVGIAGPSCSGKTALARRLAEKLPGRTAVIELDWYYRDQSGHSLDDIDVDVPEAIDDALAVVQLERLVDGHAVERPVYDYTTHARTGETVRVEPAEFYIVEGLFTLYWDSLRRLLGASIYIDADHGICLARRIGRDTRERGRTLEEVMRQYHHRVRPMAEKFVVPTARHADLILPGTDPVDSLAARAALLVAERRGRFRREP